MKKEHLYKKIQQNNQSKSNLQVKLKNLLINKTLNIKILKPHFPPKCSYEDIAEDLTNTNFKKVSLQFIKNKQMIDIGQACKGIIIKKDQTNKQLLIHLTKLVIIEPQSKYTVLTKSSNIMSNKNQSTLQYPQEKYIHHLNQYAFIKDYNLVNFILHYLQRKSHFQYLHTLIPTETLNQVLRFLVSLLEKKKDIISQSDKNIIKEFKWIKIMAIMQNFVYYYKHVQIWYQISIKNQITSNKNYGKMKVPKYGINFDDRFANIINDQYEKNKNFSISDLALYTANFQNDFIIKQLRQNIDIGLNQNINPISNLNALKHLHIHFQRIRQVQEKKWAKDYFNEGLQFLKRGNNQYAIENLDLAKKFDKKNEKIYIAKGCALANMNNFSQGLKQIKEALRINPQNKQANQYYKTIRQKLRQKQQESDIRKKQSQEPTSRIIIKKN